jgi:PEP-CTERM motif
MNRLSIAIAAGLSLVASAAGAQVTGVQTGTLAQVQLTPLYTAPYPNGVVPITATPNMSGAFDDGHGSYGTFATVSEFAVDHIEFKNGNVSGGLYSQATTSTTIDITFKNDGLNAVLPQLQSTILPAGFGMYIADIGSGCASDISGCSQSLSGATLAGLLPSQSSADPHYAGASFSFSILSDGHEIYSLAGSMTLDYDPDLGMVLTPNYDVASGFLQNFTEIAPLDGVSAFGVAWDATPIVVALGDINDLLDPGESRTLTYKTTVSSYTQTNCQDSACLIAYSAFGDPVGRGGGISLNRAAFSAFADSFSIQADAPAGGIAGVDIQPFTFGLPTFRDGVLTYQLTAVPEPSSWALMIMAMGALGAALRRRRAPSPV